MAAKFTFDGPNKLLILKAGVTDIDVQVDLYSDWKEEIHLSDNLKYEAAMRAIGGDPITATQDAGATYFMINGWRIRPQETDHVLRVTGNLFTDPSGSSPFVPTLGSYNVFVEYFVSNLVDSSVARLDLTQLLQGIYIDAVAGDDANTGTPTSPVKTVAAARVLADEQNLSAYNFRGTITLNQNHDGWAFYGLSSQENDLVNLGGYSVDKSRFEGCSLSGAMTGAIEAKGCQIKVVSGLQGFLQGCDLDNDLSLAAAAATTFDNCTSGIPGTGHPVVTLGSGASTTQFRNYSGGLEIAGLSDAGANVSVDLDPGDLTVASSCTAGVIKVRGTGNLADNSAGATVNSDSLVRPDDVRAILQANVGRAVVSPDDLTVTIYDRDGVTPLLVLDVTADGRERAPQ